MDSSNTIKKNYKLMGTDSDPLIIAQRLLNLYRQLHIFSPEKKEAYNQMLMEQSPEVKRTLGALPGGIVVQQYLADIEEQAGVAVDSYDDDDVSAVGGGDDNNETAPKVVVSPASVTVASNPEMIKEIVSAFKEAIVTSEKNRKEDTKELAQTIIALQSKLTQTMLGKQPVISDNSLGSASSLAEIVTGTTQAQSQLIKDMEQAQSQLLKDMAQVQNQLIKDMAQTQTQELSQLISSVLKEIQQMSTQTLVDAVQTVHRESMDFFKNQIFSSVSLMPMSTKMAEPKAQSEYEESKAAKVHIDDLDNVNPVSLDEDFDNIPQEQSQVVVTPVETSESAEPPASETSVEPELEQPYDLPSYEDGSSASDDDYEWEYVEEEEPPAPSDETASDDDYEWEYVEDDGSELQDGYEYVEAEAPTDETASDDDYEWEYVEDDSSDAPTDAEAPISLDEYNDNATMEETQPDLSAEPEPQSEPKTPSEDSFDADPYNPNLKSAASSVENPLLGRGDNLVFKDDDNKLETISLGDDFGLSSSDDSMSLPR